LAALSALHLVQQGELELDTNVNEYLLGWKLPENEFTVDEKVTLRRLLTHTAGITVHGFPGYTQTDKFPTISQVLDGKGNTSKIEVDTIPGSIWRYSGGGYTVMEKIVEDTSQLSLDAYMDKFILPPLGMKNSTFQQPIGKEHYSNISAAYDYQGNIIKGLWHNYPEQAAAGLWTTAIDLAQYAIEIHEIYNGKKDSILTKETVDTMLTKHKGDWGLGLALKGEDDSLIFMHGGKNKGFTNKMLAFAKTGNAIIVMTNADNARTLIDEIFLSVSSYYHWDISKQNIIEVIQVSDEYLNQLAGTYKYDKQVPKIGDYFVEVSTNNNNLIIVDSHEGITKVFRAIDKTNFIEIESGDKLTIKFDQGKTVISLNNRFTFIKVN
jgi:CubicO group peptidase (beta-lactamase class C family)